VLSPAPRAECQIGDTGLIGQTVRKSDDGLPNGRLQEIANAISRGMHSPVCVGPHREMTLPAS
jgi:hypothetical protein